jgi:prepilin-type N-terminal cleavage/methylation domain-containing protein
MRRRGFTLLEVLVALLLLTIGVLGMLAARQHALAAERRVVAARREREAQRSRHEQSAARRTAWPARAGLTLLELLVALVLGAVVIAAAAAAAGTQRATMVRRDAQRAAERLATDASTVLVTELRELWQPVAMGDSAVQGGRIVGGGLTCAPGLLPDGGDAVWRTTPRAHDVWWEWTGAAWEGRGLARVSRGRCPDGSPAWRGEGASDAPAWTPVRVIRVARWVVYRDATGAAQLGLREANGTRWDAVQPVVGPADTLRMLFTPTDSGARLEVTAIVSQVAHQSVQWVHPRNP